jgi:beta-mannosidase
VRIPKNDAIDVKTWRVQDILGGEPASNVIFYITFETGEHTYYNIAYPERQKNMAYTPAHITTSIQPAQVEDNTRPGHTAVGYAVTLTTDRFARAVFLKTKGILDFFSDNYFDLLPHQSCTIHVRSSKPIEQFRQELEITSLGDTYSQ